MRISGIYKIESIIRPERFYIGSGVNLQSRKRQHFSDLRLNKHGNSKLQNHYNKYGANDLVFIIIEPCFQELLIIREQYYLNNLKPWFNICLMAKNCLGVKRTEDTKQKIREANLGKWAGEKNPCFGENFTDEHRLNISKALTGKKLSKKHKENISKGLQGAGSGTPKGTKLSQEHRDKISKGLKGHKTSLKGKKISKKHRENIRLGWVKRKQKKEELCQL